MKRLRYIGKTLKQDVTDQKTWSKLVTKQGEMEWNDETYISGQCLLRNKAKRYETMKQIYFFNKPISVS